MKTNIYILALLLPLFSWGQQLESSIDRNEIAIGEAINYQIKVMTDTTNFVDFPQTEMMGKLEVIDNFPVDTLRVKEKYQLIKKYNLTQFDSGHYVLPRQIVKINRKDFYTDSLQVLVKDIPVDTTAIKIYDIKTVVKANGKPERFNFKPWFWLLLLIPLLAIIVAFVIFKRRKKQIAKVKKKRLPPLKEAKLGFKKLDTSSLEKTENAKEYYSKLTAIVRTYIGRDVHIPSLETTSRELIQRLKETNRKEKLGISKDTIAKVAEVLSRADLIKFAKFKPLPNEMALDRKTAEDSILEIEKEIHRPVLNEQGIDIVLAKKQAIAKKAKNKKMLKWLAGILLVLGLIIGTGIYFGFTYLKDKMLGSTTLELLETKEWITSQYGYPPVEIATPRLLTYEKIELDAATKQLIDEVSIFKYGTLRGGFGLIVSTANFKEKQKELEAKPLAQYEIANLIKQGFKIDMPNIKEEELTRNDKSGYSISGVYKYENPLTKTVADYVFKLMLFADAHGYQSIVVGHKKDDRYGAQLAIRILDSVVPLDGELIKVKDDEDDE
jgi:hypothetical protein